MCAGIALSLTELPVEWHGRADVQRRIHQRGGEAEARFLYRDPDPLLPVLYDRQLRLVPWGNRRGRARGLPKTGWTWKATIQRQGWAGLETHPVIIPANAGCERGIWFALRQGIEGLLVFDPMNQPYVYMVVEPASHYYRTMTRSPRMPALIGERI